MGELSDITRLLLESRGSTTFQAAGYCMFPRIRPGDRITMKACRIEEIAVGKVAVFQRDNRLIAHRVVEFGEHDGRPYLVTRPDRARFNEAPLSAADILGVVTRVQRGNREVSLAASPLSSLSKLLIDLYLAGFTTLIRLSRRMAGIIGLLQETQLYRAIAGRMVKNAHTALKLHIPLLPGMEDPVRIFSLDDIPIDTLREAPAWSITLSRENAPAATLNITHDYRHPDTWWIGEIVIRCRYRGMGFEERLLEAGEACLSRFGAVRVCIAQPMSSALHRAVQQRGFREASRNSLLLEKIVSKEDHHG